MLNATVYERIPKDQETVLKQLWLDHGMEALGPPRKVEEHEPTLHRGEHPIGHDSTLTQWRARLAGLIGFDRLEITTTLLSVRPASLHLTVFLKLKQG